MILKRLKLKNYLQHTEKNIEISGTLIAVVGKNGAGKSNLLGAIQFALTGEQPGYAKSELLSWGAKDGTAILEFEHNGAEGKITRSISGSAAEFTYGDVTVRGITAVAAAIKEHLGVDKDLAKQIVFVRQAEIDSILFTDPRVRELSFQRMMGIGDVAKIYDTLGKKLSSMAKQEDYDMRIADSKAQLESFDGRFVELSSTLDAAKAKLDCGAPIKDLKAELSSIDALSNAIKSYETAQLATTASEEILKKCESDLSVVGTADATTISSLDNELRELSELKTIAAGRETARAEIEKATAQLSELGRPKYAHDDLSAALQERDDKKSAYNRIDGERRLYTTLKDGIRSAVLTTCPVCGSELDDPEAASRHVLTALGDIQKKQKDVEAELNNAETAFNKIDAEIAAYAKKENAINTVKAQAENWLKKTESYEEAVSASGGVAGICARMATVSDELRRAREVALEINRLNAVIATEIKHVARARADLVASADVAVKFGFDPSGKTSDELLEKKTGLAARRNAVEMAVLAQTELAQQLASMSGAKSELATAMTKLAETVSELVEKKKTQAGLADALQVLGNVRDWFHYANGPHVMSSMVLGALTADVNKFLGQFTAPFTVEPMDSSLGFKCTFTDGRRVPDEAPGADKLSGGQKIQLAVAFRFAAYCMFAGKLGLLSLDEPTAYLDDQNIGRFGDLLGQIKGIAKDMGIQVLMATHERSVMPFMDTIIDLGA